MSGRPATLGALFADTARAWPERIAVVAEDVEIDYRTLAAIGGAWATTLTERWGVGPGDVALLFLPRDARLIIAVYALATLGCTIVPLSQDVPPARLSFVADHAEAKVVLVAGAAGKAAIRGVAAAIVDIESLPAAAPEGGAAAPHESSAPAYLIYTSGTTGEPKGVATSHDAILRRYRDWNAVFDFERAPLRILQTAKPGFDVFIGDVIKAFGSGGTLVICPDAAILQPQELVRWLKQYRIDYFDTVPALLRCVVEHVEAAGGDLSGLAIINCGADFWTKGEYLHAREVLKIGRLFNGYGVTECAVESMLFEDDGTLLATRETLPIGRPMSSDRVLIVDDSLRPVPVGTVGQLCLGGPCVAIGYVKQPELNARAFVELPHAPEAGRVYLTGDLARIAPDGMTEFVGRKDAQIKIRGNRVEIHEIERVLERHPSVRQAVAHYDTDRSVLRAFVVLADDAAFDRPGLAAFCATYLPPYMRPADIRAVGTLPLNSNNKVDRNAVLQSCAPDAAQTALSGCGNLQELEAALARHDLDLRALTAEFVKPSARRTILYRPAPAPPAGSSAALDLLVLLENAQALKKARADLYGNPIAVLPSDFPDARAVAVSVGGFHIRFQFKLDCGTVGRDQSAAPLGTSGARAGHDDRAQGWAGAWIVSDDGLLIA